MNEKDIKNLTKDLRRSTNEMVNNITDQLHALIDMFEKISLEYVDLLKENTYLKSTSPERGGKKVKH